MMLLQSDDRTIYLINCVDKGSFLQVGFVYAEPQRAETVTVADDANKFVLTLPDTIKNATSYVTGVNFKFNYGN